jgi:hypothetical protein
MAAVVDVKKEIRHESRGREAGQDEQAWEILKRER